MLRWVIWLTIKSFYLFLQKGLAFHQRFNLMLLSSWDVGLWSFLHLATRGSPSFFSCDGTCWKWHLSFQVGTMGYLSFTIPGCLFSNPSLWKSCGTIVSSLLGFISNCLYEQKFATLLKGVPFKCHMNAFLILCRSMVFGY